MKTGQFTINRTLGTNNPTVDGYIDGPFGINRQPGGFWLVTHIPTGNRLEYRTTYKTRKAALSFVKELLELPIKWEHNSSEAISEASNLSFSELRSLVIAAAARAGERASDPPILKF